MNILLQLLLSTVFALGASRSTEQTVSTGDAPLRTIPNNAFAVGEKLTFDISYGFITAGQAMMTIPDYKYINGRQAFEINTYAVSTETMDNIFRVRDKYSTFLDVDGLYPHRFEQHVREGKYSKDYDAFFDQQAGTAETDDGQKYKIPRFVHDILSAFYYVRALDLRQYHKGDKITLQNFYDGNVHPLDVMVRGRQQVQVGAGTFNCVVVEPLVVAGGLFKNEGSIVVWLSDDENKIPVKMSSKVVVGSISVELQNYSGLKNAASAKVE
ncbi:MAG TPA: DUF3108 domain-containing protein [Candidatus Kapabacteria bacterium]|nr:DUF3108 domain-containing protein [Candidatus Kapabacteria bacterium]